MSEWSELDAISNTKQTLQIFTFLKNVSCILTYMKKTSFHILRIGLAIRTVEISDFWLEHWLL